MEIYTIANSFKRRLDSPMATDPNSYQAEFDLEGVAAAVGPREVDCDSAFNVGNKIDKGGRTLIDREVEMIDGIPRFCATRSVKPFSSYNPLQRVPHTS
jgi:hypothetical protein